MMKHITLNKKVGETPLSCAEDWRTQNPEYKDTPLAYAGRLDPMASGKLLILIGDECKKQTDYHSLDKEYEFSVLFYIGSDTHDVLGRLETPPDFLSDQSSDRVRLGLAARSALSEDSVTKKIIPILNELTSPIELPYPHFSAKTVRGKPLHVWTLENRLNEISIPTKKSQIYEIELTDTETIDKNLLVDRALEKINSIPPVTDLRKSLGNDFRRVDIRQDWENVRNDTSLPETYTIVHLRCLASSGTYMRSLAKIIGKDLNTLGLAWHIHRTKIGVFDQENKVWEQEY